MPQTNMGQKSKICNQQQLQHFKKFSSDFIDSWEMVLYSVCKTQMEMILTSL